MSLSLFCVSLSRNLELGSKKCAGTAEGKDTWTMGIMEASIMPFAGCLSCSYFKT